MAVQIPAPAMELTDVGGVELDVHDRGTGDPVVFVHGSMGDECSAVLAEPALTERFRLVHYHRRGWGRSSTDGLPLSISEQARDCRAVMDHLGIDRAHLVGLSYGGVIVLQFALDMPEAAHSLALLEPGLPDIQGPHPEFQALMARAMPLLEAGDVPAGLDTVFRTLAGPDYAAVFGRTLPSGWFDRWVADFSRVAVPYDIPALEGWRFSSDDAALIDAPVLNLTGADTPPFFHEIHETLKQWLPHAEAAVIPGAAHTMLQTAPVASADRLARFFAEHPLRG